MTFQEIFNEEGMYQGEFFSDGVCFCIKKNMLEDNTLEMRLYTSTEDRKPKIKFPVIFASTFTQSYKKVKSKKELFK